MSLSATPTLPSRPAAPRWRRWLRRSLLGLLLIAGLLAMTLWALLRASLPQLDGRIQLPGLSAPLSVARDSLGTAVLQGENRLDLARGLGFVHAQERFFEMDLSRRSAAGELAALFGPKAVERDQERRVHRLRARLSERLAGMSEADRALLQAYASGVNAGLAALRVRPWQYLLLRAEPQDWTPVDSLLVIGEMFTMLQSGGIQGGFERALLREKAGDTLFDWLHPRGGRWDAALDGSQLPPLPLPGPELLNLQKSAHKPEALARATSRDEAPVGSNNWAVAGSRTADGRAILADDMHLSLSVPSIWYRTQLQLGRGEGALRAAGLSLPGVPSLVVGSNGQVAWGFTNAYGQWFDWIALPAEIPAERLRVFNERIEVKGEPARAFRVQEVDGAPIAKTLQGQRYALRWAAHQGEAYNLGLDQFLQARSVDEVLALAQRAGLPHQNLLVADRQGQIAWTVAGRLWSGSGLGERYARFQSLDSPARGWLAPADYPVIKNPSQGQLWTANNRQAAGAWGELIGDGGFDLGARAQQVRDRLSEKPRHDEASLAAIQLDHEARFIKSWARRAEARLAASPAPTAAQAEALRLLQQWNGQAAADQAGYRLARSVRLRCLDALWEAWSRAALGKDLDNELQGDEKTRIGWKKNFEYSAVQALELRPAHLLPPGFSSWEAFEMSQIDAAMAEMSQGSGKERRPLAEATWGEANPARIQHVLSRAIPALSRWLDMPVEGMDGDGNLPQVMQQRHGQSQRLVVAPGHEARGLLSMPGGQSGHPLSPYYGAGHADFMRARPTPLLAGPAKHQLEARP